MRLLWKCLHSICRIFVFYSPFIRRLHQHFAHFCILNMTLWGVRVRNKLIAKIHGVRFLRMFIVCITKERKSAHNTRPPDSFIFQHFLLIKFNLCFRFKPSQLIEQTWQKRATTKYQKKFKSCWCVKLVSFNPLFFYSFINIVIAPFFFCRLLRQVKQIMFLIHIIMAARFEPTSTHHRMANSDKCNFYLPIRLQRAQEAKMNTTHVNKVLK